MEQSPFSRRNFIKLSGMGIMGSLVPYSAQTKPAPLSVQLYTVREQIVKDIRGTLKKIAAIGFKNVETAFWPAGMSLQKASEALKEFNLNVSSSHIELPEGDQKQVFLDTAFALECKKLIWHGWPEDKRYGSIEGTRELINIYNKAGRLAKDNGLQFGIHNHWWEYKNKVNGKYVFEVLNAELDPDIFFEVDTYWVKVAGHDPATVISQLGKRVKLLHIKDGPAKWNDKLSEDIPDPMTPVGQGTQDFPAIIKAAKQNPEFLVIEMDKTTIDVFDALKQSFDYMISKGLGVA